MTRQLILGFASLLFAFFFVFTFSETAVGNENINIANTGVWIHDPDRILSPEQALEKAKHMPGEAIGKRLKRNDRGYWLVSSVKNESGTDKWAASLYFSRYDLVELKIFDGITPVFQDETGHIKVSTQKGPSLNPGYIMAFDIPVGEERTVLLRLESENFVNVSIDVGPYQPLHAFMEWRRIATTLAFGALLALILYNLFLLIALKDISYLYYCLHAFGYASMLFVLFGYAGSIFGVENHTFTLFPMHMLMCIFGVAFIYKLLNIAQHSIVLARTFKLYVLGVFLFGTAFFLGDYYKVIPLWNLYSFLLPCLVMIAVYKGWRGGERHVVYVFIGWTPMFVIYVLSLGAIVSKITLPPNVAIVNLIGVTFEMLLLSLALADRVRKLHSDKILAEETNHTKSAFLATMSHEVRTPLNGILGTLELLRRTTLSSHQQRYLETIHTSGSALLSLLNNVLDYARAEANKITVTPEAVGLSGVMESIVDLNRSRAESKELNLSLTIDRTIPETISCDGKLLRQILLNLIGNAVKFTEYGSVGVKVSKHDNSQLLFEVRDTGPGIPSQAIPTLFDRFTRVEESSTRLHGGTGLGLAIAKQMVEAMKGEIGVNSQKDKGSCFFFYLPLISVSKETVIAKPITAVGGIEGLRVLIVDDTQINREITEDFLKQEGCSVVTVESGALALEQISCSTFDVVLMDLFMPGMDGAKTTQKLLKLDETVSVIGITAATSSEDRAYCVSAGMQDVLLKPLDFDILRSVLKRVIKENRSKNREPVLLNEAILIRNEDILGSEKLEKMFADYHKRAHALLEEIKAAKDEMNMTALEKAAHSLAGLSSSIGLEALGMGADNLCQNSRQNAGGTDKTVDSLSMIFDKSLLALNERYANYK